MEKNRSEKKEISFINEDDSISIPAMFEALFIKSMGKTLDLIRISDISDRNLTQLQRTIKDDCYQQIEFAKAILKKHGIEDVNGK